MFQRFCLFIVTGAIVSILLIFALYTSQFQLPGTIHLSNLIPSALKSSIENAQPAFSFAIAGSPVSATRANSTFASDTVLVLATLANDDNTWVRNEMGDMLQRGDIDTAIYVVNNQSAPLHTPANKGHEAMAYLTYMIDFYDKLPEISIFMHGHPTAWHNNYLLDMSSSALVRYLSHEKVQRDGYVNLRCHWNPGCPDHLYPFATEYDSDKSEEFVIKDAWMEVFEVTESEVPQMLAQPCCSQFAVTRDRIRSLHKAKYEHFRDWLLRTKLTDYVTGRIFEYFWQYILNQTPVHCPDPRVCYCDGFGVCFEDPGEYDSFLELRSEREAYDQQLYSWNRWQRDKTVERDEIAMDRGEWLRNKIAEIDQELLRRKETALAVGADPWKRAAAIESARKHDLPLVPRDEMPWWTKEMLMVDENI